MILEARSLYVYITDNRVGSTSYNNIINYGQRCFIEAGLPCYTQIAFKGSLYHDDFSPDFTYANRQEAFGCYYSSTDALYKTLKNAIVSGGWTHLVFWNSAYNHEISGCVSFGGNPVSVKDAINRVQSEFPNNVHIVPDGTSLSTAIGVVIPLSGCTGESNNIYIGQTLVDYYAQVRNISMTSSSAGRIGIKPVGGVETQYNVVDGQTITTSSDNFNITVKVKNMWYSDTAKFMTFDICWTEKVVIKMPSIQLKSIVLNPSTNLKAGDSIVNEVCMVNNGGEGDIILTSGFADNGIFLTGAYVSQPIGGVMAGENLCPFGLVSVTQECVNKKAVFIAKIEGGTHLTKTVTYAEPVVEYCTQKFEIFDQNGIPLSGSISCPDWDTDIPVPSSGIASMTFKKGVTYTATASSGGNTDTYTFTSCQSNPVAFSINIPIAPEPEPEPTYFEEVVAYVKNLLPNVSDSIIRSAILALGPVAWATYWLYKTGPVQDWILSQQVEEPEPPIIPPVEPEGDRFEIISKSWPSSAKLGERYDIKLVVKHIRLWPDTCLVELHDRVYPGALLESKTSEFTLFDEQEFKFSRVMGNADQYFTVKVIDKNTLTADVPQGEFNIGVIYEAVAPITEDGYCLQKFTTLENGVGVNTSISVGGVDVSTNQDGYGSITLSKGSKYTAVSYLGLEMVAKDFTACALNPVVLGFVTSPVDDGDGDDKPISEDALLIAAIIALAFMFGGS